MRGLQGHLRLACAVDEQQRSYLRTQSFRAPMHLSKPFRCGGMLVVNVVNPTAGLLAGDEVACEVEVEGGASLLLTAPSASRSHRMHEGKACLTQEFRVASGAFLDVWPEIFIPQAGTRYQQRTTARVEPGGELLMAELLAPGRVAAGEVFAYERLEWKMDLYAGADLIARERYTLKLDAPEIQALRKVFPQAYYGSIYVVSPRLSEASACWQVIHESHRDTEWVGVSRLRQGKGWVVKVIAAGSVPLRRAMGAARAALYAALGREQPDLRRAGISPNGIAPPEPAPHT